MRPQTVIVAAILALTGVAHAQEPDRTMTFRLDAGVENIALTPTEGSPWRGAWASTSDSSLLTLVGDSAIAAGHRGPSGPRERELFDFAIGVSEESVAIICLEHECRVTVEGEETPSILRTGERAEIPNHRVVTVAIVDLEDHSVITALRQASAQQK